MSSPSTRRVLFFLFLAVAAGTTGCASATSSAAVPQRPDMGGFRCAAAVPASTPSLRSDRVYVRITAVSVTPASISVHYALATARHAVLLIPIGPTAPTLLLADNGKIAGAQTRPFFETSPAMARAAIQEALDLTGHPYQSQLTLTRLCGGFTWADVSKNHSRYRVELVVSRQYPYPPSRKLISATATLGQ